MTTDIIVALITVIGTMTASLGGVLISNKKTLWRIEQLEKKVDRHNHLVERMAVAEASLKSAHRRIDEMHESHTH